MRPKTKKNPWLVNSIGRLLHQKPEMLYPVCSFDSILENEFADYFETKIQNISKESETTELLPADYTGNDSASAIYCELNELSSATTEEIVRIVHICATKSCNLNPVPSSVFLKHLDPLVPVITNIVDSFLESSTMPSSLMEAVLNHYLIRPLID